MSNYCTTPIKTRIFHEDNILFEFDIRYNLITSIKQIKREIKDKLEKSYIFRGILISKDCLRYQLTFDDIEIKANDIILSHYKQCYQYSFHEFKTLDVFIQLPETKENNSDET